MNVWLKIGKYYSNIILILFMWAFLWALPMRSYNLARDIPSFFQVPFSVNSIWKFLLIGFTPIAIFGYPLHSLNKKYKKWNTDRIIQEVKKEFEFEILEKKKKKKGKNRTNG